MFICVHLWLKALNLMTLVQRFNRSYWAKNSISFLGFLGAQTLSLNPIAVKASAFSAALITESGTEAYQEPQADHFQIGITHLRAYGFRSVRHQPIDLKPQAVHFQIVKNICLYAIQAPRQILRLRSPQESFEQDDISERIHLSMNLQD